VFNYQELVQAIIDDVEARLHEKNQRREEKLHQQLKEDLRTELMGMVQYEKDFMRYLWMRVIQDRVYMHMSDSIAPGSDPKQWASFADLVTEYESNF